MYLLVLLLIIGLRSSGVQGKGKQYECGEHGRFEYCVDGAPNCVVGCHCHPGYYFDTETKICEPNTKLVQEYRRLYLPEPTRVPIPMTPAYEIEVTPTLSTKTPLDNQVDQALAKDTDDIGDWLYNQFFKTIENQVMSNNNSTDNSNTANNQTRRGGSGPSQKKPKRKKVIQKKIKFREISKKDDLRRKLLRITEDDSLFNSDSNDRSTEDSKSSSNSDSSDTSIESDHNNSGDEKKNKHADDKEHGHRKILVINKKPKAPLPSFIFLPNLETPFYPPIGLPPPPAMPMYPMVPVPPMPFSFTMVIPMESNGKTKQAPMTTTEHKHTTTHKPHEKTDAPARTTKKATATEATKDKTTDKPDKATTKPTDRPSLRNRLKRKKLLRQFRERHPGSFGNRKAPAKQMPRINPLMPSITDYMDIADAPMIEDMATHENAPPGPPPVDFKYLSQLIHKMNPNVSNSNIRKKVALPERRFDPYYHRNPNVTPDPFPPAAYELEPFSQVIHAAQEPAPVAAPSARPPEGDDSYYANLGQQIASLIRKLDNEGSQSNPQTPATHIINGDNGYASRSYWERSVRSLFSHYPPNSNDINFLRNEESLLNLENKVKVVATTQRSWNLNELENVFFLVDRVKAGINNIKIKNSQEHDTENSQDAHFIMQSKVMKPLKPLKTSDAEKSLNINLLPKQTDMLLDRKAFAPFPERRNIQEPLVTVSINETKNKTMNLIEEFVNRQNIHYNLRGILMQNFKNIFQKSDSQQPPKNVVRNRNNTTANYKSIPKPIWEGTTLRKIVRMDQLQSMLQNKHQLHLRQKEKAKVKPRPKHEGNGELFLSSMKVLPKPSASNKQISPILSSYKNTPLYPSHHSKYIFENDALAFQLAPAATKQERAYYQVPHHHNYFD